MNVIPDAERVVVGFFRAQPELARLDDRIFTSLPAHVAWPAARVVRWGGWPALAYPLWLDEAWCQVDIWGGSKAEVSALAGLMRALVDERLVAEVPTVAGITFGMLQDSPDSTFEPAKPHFRFDLSVRLHPELLLGPPTRAGRPGPPSPIRSPL